MDDVREDIIIYLKTGKVLETLLNEKMQTEYTTWIEELKEEYKITNHLTS